MLSWDVQERRLCCLERERGEVWGGLGREGEKERLREAGLLGIEVLASLSQPFSLTRASLVPLGRGLRLQRDAVLSRIIQHAR
jgi:hypothetical protein